MSGQERTDELVACAEEEGQLNVYTSDSDMDDLVDGFGDEYDVDVNVYRANGETVLQRLLQEDGAGYYGADVLEIDALELDATEQEGLLHPYESEFRDSGREEGRQSEAWTGTRFNAFVVGWNTDNVKPGEEPTSVEDLAEQQWKGRVSMELGDVDWFMALHDYYVEEKGMSEDEFDDMMTRLASNSQIVKGHTVQGELLSAGQFDVGVSLYSHTVDKAAAGGAPVAWQPARRRARRADRPPYKRHRFAEDRQQPVRRNAVRGLRVDRWTGRLPRGLPHRRRRRRGGPAGGVRGLPGARAEAARRLRHVGQGLRGRGRQRSGPRMSETLIRSR